MYGSLTFLISALLIGAVGIESESGSSYTVSEIIHVRQPTVVVCRLRDYVQPTRVRFSVRLRDVAAPDDVDAAAGARDSLEKRLAQAQHIRLQNVDDHGYFHLTADIYADGVNLGAAMLQGGLLRPLEPEKDEVSQPEPVRWEFVPPEDKAAPKHPAPSELSADTQRGFGRKVEIAHIRPETGLRDALRMISSQSSPPLPILVMWGDLERNALITPDSPVGLEGFGQVPAEQALRLVLLSVQSPGMPLRMVHDGGVVTIATGYADIEKPRAVVYPVADLISPPWGRFRHW